MRSLFSDQTRPQWLPALFVPCNSHTSQSLWPSFLWEAWMRPDLGVLVCTSGKDPGDPAQTAGLPALPSVSQLCQLTWTLALSLPRCAVLGLLMLCVSGLCYQWPQECSPEECGPYPVGFSCLRSNSPAVFWAAPDKSCFIGFVVYSRRWSPVYFTLSWPWIQPSFSHHFSLPYDP